jgi:probable rRNA maturation factor
MIHLHISEELAALDIPNAEVMRLLERAAAQALQQSSAPEADLSIVITGDEQSRQLNRQFLEINAPTDVLSFPSGDADPDTGLVYLGDVLISVPRAQAQALAGGHAVSDELQLLVVHGVLHLLGHDHAEPDDKTQMWQLQSDILRQLGCPLTSPPA